ncbi:MAG: endonuclease/exonuclease/phosphatase family protein [Cyclobacteriaceae bacterium]
MNQILIYLFYYITVFALSLQCATDGKPKQNDKLNRLSVLTFNILQGGHDATNVGFPNSRFNGSRFDNLAGVISKTNPDIIGVQEDTNTDSLLIALGSGWNRCYNIYSKFELAPLETNGELLNACRVFLPNGDSLVFVNCHWNPSGSYGPAIIKQRMLAGDIPCDLKLFEKEILQETKQISDGPRGYKATIDMIQPYLKANEKVILAGDFNEPSHLDWTERYARKGKDRWVKNPTLTPLRFSIEWQGSKAIENIGLSDAYRTVNTDEVSQPGITWTPPYQNGAPGRQDYDNQVLVRIDRIYFNNSGLNCIAAYTVTGSKGNGEIKLDCDWPSDHWAVLAEFEIN